MFLKSIELFGFKSFADRTNIEFADGISALLGPNGCGKSNVVDAIKWVLGEQASRSLRAERMEDVIFNGTEERKAVNVADVTLTLSNEADILPMDTAEISVRRRLFRSGESEYFLNGELVKLRDLRELFYDTGIGKTAYSIMEQGKIDQVLSNKPEERRLIFEEAAGITKYKVKGREAERRLERTEENMRQVQGILGEVRRSYESLKQQADRTIRYREIREDVFRVELDLTLLRLRDHVADQDKRKGQLEKRAAHRDGLKAEIDGINESLEENLDVVNTMESELIEQQKALYGVELAKNNDENQIRIHEERITELDQKIASDQTRQATTTGKIAGLREEIEQLSAGIADHRQRIEEVDKNISDFEEHVVVAESRIKENEQEILRHQETIEEQERSQIELEEALRQVTDTVVQQLDEGLAKSGYSHTHRKKLESAFSNILKETQAKIKAVLPQLGGGKSGSDGVVQSAGELQRLIDSLSDAFGDYVASVPAFLDDFLAPEGIITKKREVDTALQSSRDIVRACRKEITRLNKENSGLAGKIGEYRGTLEELRLNRVRMSTQVNAMETTQRERANAIAEHETQFSQTKAEIEVSQGRVKAAGERIAELRKNLKTLSKREGALRKHLNTLEKSISTRNKDLVDKERGLKRRMEDLGKAQTQLENLQISLAESSAEIRNLYENFRERFSQELTEHESRMLEIQAKPGDLRRDLSKLREQERSLGAVNLAAPEEFEEVRQRFEFLSGQLDDLKSAREDLERVTGEIQAESAALFTETYQQIKKNFHTMFRSLFGGGRAELKLVDANEVLESGIDILAQPPGKKLENIALLSGGERSLTAVALLFATYMVRPSPFCLLDEIDAALDESNVGRFTEMLMEFGKSSQFIVITHNKKTVASAGTLLGVTMQDSGVSKVIALRIGDREEVHA